jgi:hypothetical protein
LVIFCARYLRARFLLRFVIDSLTITGERAVRINTSAFHTIQVFVRSSVDTPDRPKKSRRAMRESLRSAFSLKSMPPRKTNVRKGFRDERSPRDDDFPRRDGSVGMT